MLQCACYAKESKGCKLTWCMKLKIVQDPYQQNRVGNDIEPTVRIYSMSCYCKAGCNRLRCSSWMSFRTLSEEKRFQVIEKRVMHAACSRR